MKNLMLTAALLLSTVFAQAQVVRSNSVQINPSSIDKIIKLVDKTEKNSNSQKKVSIVVTDNGLSTDVSPRYKVYLGYASLAEMGNITTDFLINDQAFKFISASRKSAGIYEVTVEEVRDDGVYQVTQTIDATQMFIDEKEQRTICGGDFCDRELTTAIKIKETVKKLY